MKENYIVIVITLNNIYEKTHQPEAFSSKFQVNRIYYVSNNKAQQDSSTRKTTFGSHIFPCGSNSALTGWLFESWHQLGTWATGYEESLEEAMGVNITTSDIQT